MVTSKELSLEDAINEVSRLRTGLYAEKVIQEMTGHAEQQYPPRSRGGYSWDKEISEPEEVWIVDVPAVTEPDMHKRNAARKELTDIYQQSNWYSARYAAGLALFDESQFKDNTFLWVDDLRKRLNAIAEGESFPNDGARVDAVKDLAKLYGLSRIPVLKRELKDVYAHNESWVARVEAGEQLGYSRLRIKLHEMTRS